MSEWRIQGIKTYVSRGTYPDAEYLCPDGNIYPGGQGVRYYFDNKDHAKRAIKEWETKMNREEVQKRIENAQRELEEAQKELKKLEKSQIIAGIHTSYCGGRGIFFKVTPEIVNLVNNHLGEFVIVNQKGENGWDRADCQFTYGINVEKIYSN